MGCRFAAANPLIVPGRDAEHHSLEACAPLTNPCRIAFPARNYTRMNRIVGIETEYGCLVSDAHTQGSADSWPVRVKNHVFKKARLGAIDLHYRYYEEPRGNGGFLLNVCWLY